MKPDEIINAFSHLDDDVLHEAAKMRERRSKRPMIIKLVAIAACVCLVISAALFLPAENTPTFPNNGKAFAVEAEYPDMPQYPSADEYEPDDNTYYNNYHKWEDYTQAVNNSPLADNGGLKDFVFSTAKEFISDEDEKNTVYSPFSMYIALSMLSEITGGESRQQVLELLGSENIESLREKVNALYLANYRDDGITKSLFANSLWLNNSISFKQDTLNILKDNYFASSYSGDMSDKTFFETYKNWINSNTGELLKNEVENLEPFTPDIILSLVNTLELRVDWESVFNKTLNYEDYFNAVSGKEKCEYMYENKMNEYYWGDNFSAVTKKLKKYGKMMFILPNEDESVQDVLKNEQMYDMLLDSENYANIKGAMVELSVPKFDITSEYDMLESFENLGLVDVLDSNKSDFTPITDTEDLVVSQAKHAARLIIDEDGCLGSAFTVISVSKGTSSGPPKGEENIIFKLDRPFIFAVLSDIGTPLFIGTVNNPA